MARASGKADYLSESGSPLCALRLAQSNPRANEIALSYGHLIFGSEPSARGEQAIEDVEAARREIEDLIAQSPNVSAAWAERWSASLGVIADDAEGLHSVGIHWVDVAVGALEEVEKISLP